MSERQRISLDGIWQFWFESELPPGGAALPEESARQARVPAPWQADFPEMSWYTGPVWYRRIFRLPDRQPASRVMLGFGAADQIAEVWVNGQPAGEHTGGYLPFELDVTALARGGENEVRVRVSDPADLFQHLPHGKQSWYGLLSGLWQPVWVEIRAETYIADLQVEPQPGSGDVLACIRLNQPADGASVQVVARLADGAEVARALVAAAGPAVEARLNVPSPRWWSPEQPTLYRLEATLQAPGQAEDHLAKTFGFRTIETRDGALYLNGQPLYLRAALDQAYYPDTIYTPPSEEFLVDEMTKARALGLNCLRLHIKIEDPRYYDIADRLGMLVWTELPNWSIQTERSEQVARETLAAMVARDGHHPSIIIWTIINEDWGTELTVDARHRAWLKDTFAWLKQLDPTRLVVDNSACPFNFHLHSDLDDYHIYRAYPDHRSQWQQVVAEFAGRPDWTYSPHGDAIRTGKEPLVLSEFGNWGLPDIDRLMKPDGSEPWWFDTGLEWGDAVVYPRGIKTRYHNLGLDKVFGGWKAFIEATQWQQFFALKSEIEAMRLHESIQGYVITELTDVHWEPNGLMDLHRNLKVYAERLAEFNADTIIVPQTGGRAIWSGDVARIGLSVAHHAAGEIRGARLEWQVEGSPLAGSLDVPALAPYRVTALPELAFTAPELNQARRYTLRLALMDKAGRRLAASSVDVSVYPAAEKDGWPDAALWSPDAEVAAWLGGLGIRPAGDAPSAAVIVARKLTLDLLDRLNAGARVLILADGPDSFKEASFAHLNALPRAHTVWSGDWASAFGWLRRDGVFRGLPFNPATGPLVDESFEAVIPEVNLFGFGAWEFQSGVQAGMFGGWVHKPAVWIGERHYGRGKLTVTSFRLLAAPKDDPVAIMLLKGLLRLASG